MQKGERGRIRRKEDVGLESERRDGKRETERERKKKKKKKEKMEEKRADSIFSRLRQIDNWQRLCGGG